MPNGQPDRIPPLAIFLAACMGIVMGVPTSMLINEHFGMSEVGLFVLILGFACVYGIIGVFLVHLRRNRKSIRDNLIALVSHDTENPKTRAFNRVIILLIFISVGFVIADTFEDMPVWYDSMSYIGEVFITVIFTFEYILRIWAAGYGPKDGKRAGARIRHVFSFSAIIDLLALLPFYIGLFLPANLAVLRTLRVLRLLRLLKVGRYTKALSVVGGVLKSKADQLVSSLAVICLLLIVASTLMYTFEHDAQPELFRNAFSGLWWAAVTITTVGYGDMYPMTPIGQLLGIIVALLGTGLVAVPTGIISAGFVDAAKKDAPPERRSKLP